MIYIYFFFKFINIHRPTITDYDPTTENEDTDLNRLLDNDDDDDDDEEETNTTQPFTPGAASTPAGDPYHGGEEHELTDFGAEQSGTSETTPLLSPQANQA